MGVPKAVFLDVGWTLVYPRASMWEILAAVAREAGAELSAVHVEQQVHRLMAGSRERALAELEAGTQYSDSDEEFAGLFITMGNAIFSRVGVPGDHGTLSARFLDRFWTRENWAVFPDALAGLQRLRAAGIRVGVLSNAGSQLVTFLEELGLLPYCDFTVVSAIEGMRKPDRRIFERALQRADVTADEAVHVGDMYVEDIAGARQVGVRPLLMDRGPCGMFPNFPESANHSSDHVEIVRSVDDVLAAIGLE